ncbi:HNH endonuclease signature motif containing protein [Labedella endophytica]|nr:HNH endonuclease signature motif containing protein [Labedella endophytica]
MSRQGEVLQERIGDAIELLAGPVAALAPARLSAPEYITALRDVEHLGRLVDAARVALAGEADKRTQGPIDTLGALGYASAVDAVAMLTSAADRDAKRRIRVGESLNCGASLTGAETGSAHPAVAAAVFAGNLSIDVATIIIDALDGVGNRVDNAVLIQAEESLVKLAAGTPDHPPLRADLVRGQVQLFLETIDPDGACPREEVARRKRRFTIGRETPEGLIPVHGLLTLEIGASFKRLLEAHVRKVSFADPDSLVDHVDDRLPQQKRHDTLADILSAAARVKDAPELAGSAPAISVTVTQAALDTGWGVGAIDGMDTPISVDAIEKLIDSRGMQQIIFNDKGRALALGSVQRCFTPSQRRVIAARDGGCVIPGCTAPAGWCEVHHVIPWRDGGRTHTDNGVLLCWGHHQSIDSGPWELSMPDGVPHVRGPGHWQWTHTTKSRSRPPADLAGGNP